MNQKWMKWGWLIFTLAGVVWIIPFGFIWLIQGRLLFGMLAMALCLLAIVVIFASVPWKYPNTRLWKLLLPPYGFFLLSVLLLLYVLTGFGNLAQVQYGLWLIPCFTPLFTVGYRTWNSFSGGNPAGNQNQTNGP
ncbi:MAG: hypothetical protein JXB25_13155 [Deltaproteobacteria bacterium]|nr:hypothetical protein [Deltaproteobacteria bacterium]